MMCCFFFFSEVAQMRYEGCEYFYQLNNALDLIVYIGQLVVNISFWFRDSQPLFSPALLLYANISLGHVVDALESAEGGCLRPFHNPDITPIGFVASLQAVVVICLFFRLLFYFRGVLALAILVHCIKEIIKSMVAFLVVLCVVTMGFACSLALLMSHTGHCDYATVGASVISVVNIGLYSIQPNHEPFQQYPMVLLFYEVFMLMVQVVLLNLLIAIMGDSYHSVRKDSQLIAVYERAKLTLEHEMFTGKATPSITESLRAVDVISLSANLAGGASRGVKFSRKLARAFGVLRNTESFKPRWLHVLAMDAMTANSGKADVHHSSGEAGRASGETSATQEGTERLFELLRTQMADLEARQVEREKLFKVQLAVEIRQSLEEVGGIDSSSSIHRRAPGRAPTIIPGNE